MLYIYIYICMHMYICIITYNILELYMYIYIYIYMYIFFQPGTKMLYAAAYAFKFRKGWSCHSCHNCGTNSRKLSPRRIYIYIYMWLYMCVWHICVCVWYCVMLFILTYKCDFTVSMWFLYLWYVFFSCDISLYKNSHIWNTYDNYILCMNRMVGGYACP